MNLAKLKRAMPIVRSRFPAWSLKMLEEMIVEQERKQKEKK